MAIKVRCPTCGAKLKAPDAAAGRPLDCPHCSQTVPVPPPAAVPPPAVAGPGESSTVEGRRPRAERAAHATPPPELDALADEYQERRARQQAEAAAEDAVEADRIGFVSLALAAAAGTCILLGCFTCGMTYWVAAPLAVAGTGCAAFSRSRLRLVGLAANLMILIPAVVVFRAAWMAVHAPTPEPLPFLK
jgi:hypothetical protein